MLNFFYWTFNSKLNFLISYQKELNTLETSLSDKDPIQFSSEPILLETPVFQFNKNIVSLKVKQLLENKSDCLKFNDNQKKICTKCRAFFSAYSETIENQWNCVICEEPNTSQKLIKSRWHQINLNSMTFQNLACLCLTSMVMCWLSIWNSVDDERLLMTMIDELAFLLFTRFLSMLNLIF